MKKSPHFLLILALASLPAFSATAAEAKRALVKLPVKVVKNKVMVNVAGFI